MNESEQNKVDDIPDEKALSEVIDDEEDTIPSSNQIVDVTLINKHPNLQGFGLDISGGIDRPYEGDEGIFVSAVRPKGLAEKSGELEVGDKILEVNGSSVSAVHHEEAVKLFISDRTKVNLRIQKNYGLFPRVASLTPSPTPSAGQVTPTIESSPRKEPESEYNSSLSISGFVIGVAVGCVGVVLLRRYLQRINT